jgi:hypothetical protein
MSVTKRDKVAIVGFAPSWKEAPFDDSENTEIWCLNEMYKVATEVKNFRADRWFEIHDPLSKSKATKEHHSFLTTCSIPLYMQKHYEEFPSSIKFPKDEIIDFFNDKGCKGSKYFTNSISWFIALAIMEGFKTVSIYGVDLATDSEYGWQRPSCEYWIGLAEGLGVEVIIPQSSDLLKCTQLYAFESNNKNRVWIKAQVTELKKRGQQFAQQQAQAHQAETQAQIAQAELRGAASAYNEILKRTQ